MSALVIVLCSYWIAGLVAPGPWFGALLAAVLLVSSTVLLIQWTPDFVAVVKEGRLGDDRFSLMGLYLIALGAAYSGAFVIAWAFAGNPSAWLNTPFSGFGRATMISGFWLLIVSPNTTPERIRLPRWWVICIAAMAIAVLAFALGVQFGDNPTREVGLLARKGSPHLLTPKPMALASMFRPTG